MRQHLTIDQGNSEAKLALWADNTLIDHVIERNLSHHTLNQFLAGRTVDAAIYSSVATATGDDYHRMLASVTPRLYRLSASLPLPITLAYATPTTLGPDRIAAAAGAWAGHQGSPLLVVDAGTAVTIDYVDPDGTYRGGNIAPGIEMQLRALHQYTARLPRVNYPESPETLAPTLLGDTTASAITLGTLYSIIGAIKYTLDHLPPATVAVLGGGCAHTLAPLIDFPILLEPHLASKGLNTILNYNENL